MMRRLFVLTPLLLPAQVPRVPTSEAVRTIAIDRRLGDDARIHIGDRVVIVASPGQPGDTVTVSAVVERRADPSEVARSEYRVRLHLDQLQSLIGYADRVDRFAIETRADSSVSGLITAVNAVAFGFRAYRSRDIAVRTSKTFLVVSRFHRAIGVITIVASGIFLLCILLLKVDERRRDVAALRLIGISRASVVKGVVLEAALVSVLGSGMGVGIGWIVSRLLNVHYQAVYRTPLVFSLVSPEIVVFATVLSLVLGIGAGFAAATRLVRTSPLVLFGR
ncbi:MAG: hypothetical protein NVS4B3_04620 [Gemmatimonadaceae bacterium]